MKYRVLRFLSLFFLSLTLITACTGTKSIVFRPEPPPLKIAYNLWPGTFPMAIAQEKGFFTLQGVNVEHAYTVNYLESVSNFVAGKSDGLFIVLGSLMGVIEKIPDVQITLIADESAGADVVLAQPDIRNGTDLKGKRIGVKLGDYGELFVTTWLEQHGLTTDNVTLVNVEGEAVPAQFQSGNIQAGQTWEPYVSEAINQSGASVLFTSEETPGLMPTVMIFRSKVLRDRPNDVQAFIRAWFQAQEYWQANQTESNALITKALDLKPENLFTDGIKFYTWQDNLKAFTPGSTTESLHHTAKLYADFYIRIGGLSATPDVQKLINPSFVQQLRS
ncbi:MAG: ABC transporter substrate-binding protein [Kastovskya adunca ATA6-11-RM4]|nr:ABC transporter substrate-binding protein [Kastovskya adunca ATA6-11-RM4]